MGNDKTALNQLLNEAEHLFRVGVSTNLNMIVSDLKNQFHQIDDKSELYFIEKKIEFLDYFKDPNLHSYPEKIAKVNEMLAKLSSAPETAELEFILRCHLLSLHRSSEIKRGFSLIDHLKHCISLTDTVEKQPPALRNLYWGYYNLLERDIKERFPEYFVEYKTKIIRNAEHFRDSIDGVSAKSALVRYFLESTDQFEKAYKLCSEVVTESVKLLGDYQWLPNSSRLLFAELQIQNNQPTEALNTIREIPPSFLNIDIMSKKAKLLLQLGQPLEAKIVFKEIISFCESCDSTGEYAFQEAKDNIASLKKRKSINHK